MSAANHQADLGKLRALMHADVRKAILLAAASVLSNEGPAALTVRRVAKAVNASTKVLYTTFGGKDGLFDALFLHSFAGLEQALQACSKIKAPLPRLRAMASAYRDYAVSEPALYNVMFGDLGRAYEAPLSSRRQAWKTFTILRDTVAACLPADRSADAAAATQILWATMHGVVSLEMRDLLRNGSHGAVVFDDAVEMFIAARSCA